MITSMFLHEIKLTWSLYIKSCKKSHKKLKFTIFSLSSKYDHITGQDHMTFQWQQCAYCIRVSWIVTLTIILRFRTKCLANTVRNNLIVLHFIPFIWTCFTFRIGGSEKFLLSFPCLWIGKFKKRGDLQKHGWNLIIEKDLLFFLTVRNNISTAFEALQHRVKCT